MENIYVKKNHREFLLLQKAKNVKYTKAKKIVYSSMIASIVGTIFFAVSTAFIASELLLVFSSFFAIVIFSVGEFFKKKSNDLISEAAKMQQTIDINLFGLSDTCFTLSPLEIKEATASYVEEDLSEFENWYNDYSSLSVEKQIFNSQKKNTRLDKTLRKKYSNFTLFFILILPLILALYAILTNASTSHFFAIASWLFPLEQFFIVQWIGLRGNLLFLDKMENVYKEYERCLAGDLSKGVDCKLCSIQNYIYNHRQSAILVPDWFYNLHKKKLRVYEDNLAKEL